MEKTAVAGGIVMAVIPGLKPLLILGIALLSIIVCIQIFQMRQRCMEKQRRLQRIPERRGPRDVERAASHYGDRGSGGDHSQPGGVVHSMEREETPGGIRAECREVN